MNKETLRCSVEDCGVAVTELLEDMRIWEKERDESWRARYFAEALSFWSPCDRSGNSPQITFEATAGAHCVARLAVFGSGPAQRPALVCSPSADICRNGYPPLPVCVLEDRDEITIAGQRFYLSAFDEPKVASYVPDARATRCARCRGLLAAGDTVAHCPACKATYHQGARAADGRELPCFDYDGRCAGCARSWEAMLWSPSEELDHA